MTATSDLRPDQRVRPRLRDGVMPIATKRRRWRASLKARGLSLVIVALALALWQGVISFYHVPSWLAPAPGDVWASFSDPDTQTLIGANIWTTVEEALAGFVLAVLIGAVLAGAMAASRVVRDGLYPLLIASQAIPTIAIGAVLVVAFGYGLTPKVVVVVLFSFFAVTVSVYDALQTLDPDLPGVLKTLGAARRDILVTAYLPAALPGLFTGAKLAATYAVAAAVYGEWTGATSGLGYALIEAKTQSPPAQVFAIVAVMAALGVVAFTLVAVLEWLALPWRRRSR